MNALISGCFLSCLQLSAWGRHSPLVGGNGGLVCKSVGKADLLCCQISLTASSPGRLLICRSLAIRFLVLLTFGFWSSEVRRLLLDLNPYGGTDPLGMFPLRNCWCSGHPCLSVVFWRLIRLDSFPACWRQANVTPIPKGPQSSSVANYRQISIHLYCLKCLSVWCRFVSDDLWNAVVCFQLPPSLPIG